MFVPKRGTPKIYIKTRGEWNKRTHAFCPECGTPIYAAAPEPNPSTYGLRVGGSTNALNSPPARQIWCRSALPWSMDLTQVDQIERGSRQAVRWSASANSALAMRIDRQRA
jgi:hypothetical protein